MGTGTVEKMLARSRFLLDFLSILQLLGKKEIRQQTNKDFPQGKIFTFTATVSRFLQGLTVTNGDRQRLIPGSPAPMAMRQSIPSGRRGHRSPTEADYNGPGLPASPKISVSPVDDDGGRNLLIGSSRLPVDKVVEVKNVGGGGGYFDTAGGGRKLPNTPMPGGGSGNGRYRMRPHRSLPSSGGSMSSLSSSGEAGSRRPPTSLSVLSANSIAEVQRNILQRHSSVDGGLTPPPRVISIENSNGFKVMTELVDHGNGDQPQEEENKEHLQNDVPAAKNKNLSSKYKPLKPISKRYK